jgi:hypothetical protein
MATELKMTLLLRRAEFADSCILKEGEPGFNTKTHEFKIGQKNADGQLMQWKDLPIANKTQIEAIVNAAIAAHAAGYYTKEEINAIKKALEDKDAELLEKINENAGAITAEATARENADNKIREDFAAADVTTLASAQSYADTKKAEVIGDATSTKDSDTVKGAKLFASDVAATAKAEAISTAAADATSKANAAEAAAKSHAETKATAAENNAKSYADAQDTALAQTVATNLSNAVSALETKITNGDSATLKSAKDYADEKVAAEAELRIAADNALDGRLDVVEAKLTNVSNVMDFVGAADALPAEGNNQSGDVIVITAGDDAGKEFVYDDSREAGKKWVEFGSTSATDAAVASLKSRMDAAESDIDQAQVDILALGTNKMDKSAFNTWEEGFDADKEAHENDHAKKQTEITADIATAKSEAITKAGELDTALHTEISKEIDADVTAAINAEVTRSDAKAKELADAAKSYADSQDTALQTAIVGTDADKSSDATIAGAKKYADEAAAGAEQAAKDYADGLADNYDAAGAAADAKAEVIGKSGDAKTADTIYGAKAFATDAANTAEQNAINAVVGTADSDADSDTIKGVKKAYAAADTAVLNSAKAYADEKVTDAHKNYQTATVKDAAHDSATNPSFITSISIDKGHVTGATVRNLAEVLAAMEFIFDGGTSAN